MNLRVALGKMSILGPLAQLVEQGTLNPKVVGSIPTRPIRTRAVMRFPCWRACQVCHARLDGTGRACPGGASPRGSKVRTRKDP